MHAYCAQNLLHKLGIFVSDKHHLYFYLFNMFIRNCIHYLHIKVGKTSTVYHDGNLIKMVARFTQNLNACGQRTCTYIASTTGTGQATDACSFAAFNYSHAESVKLTEI